MDDINQGNEQDWLVIELIIVIYFINQVMIEKDNRQVIVKVIKPDNYLILILATNDDNVN